MRRFGGVWLAEDAQERSSLTGPLGPDASTLGYGEFVGLLRDRRGGIKAALMDQRLLAGLGNLMSDEILWRAGVRPTVCLRAAVRLRCAAGLRPTAGRRTVP